jgi:hypothetical protein
MKQIPKTVLFLVALWTGWTCSVVVALLLFNALAIFSPFPGWISVFLQAISISFFLAVVTMGCLHAISLNRQKKG